MPYWFWGQKVKGQGHGAWLFENGFRTITDSVINQWSWNFIHLLTMSQGCALLILRSKGQRSRSWRMVIWKWFPDDNWLCNQPMIMKLHTLTPHEFVGVGGGPVLLQQYFQYAFICCPYMLPLLLYCCNTVNVVFHWEKISWKCWKDISHGGNFHDTTHISFIKAYGFYFRVGVIFAKKTKARKMWKITPTRKFPRLQ